MISLDSHTEYKLAISELRDDKAVVLHIADADQVPSLFAALFLSIRPGLESTMKVEAVAVVRNPRGCAETLLN